MVIAPEIRAELHAHAAEEAPNECCGVVVLRDGVADRYVRGRNALASPYRYELEIDPTVWFLEDEGYELAGLWSGRPFLIYGLKLQELRAWRVARDEAVELELTER